MDKGWIRESHSNWVARGFLVPKPGVNKWRLVIDYRYLNSCLKGHEFPLPVIGDTLLSQAGNHLWTLLVTRSRGGPATGRCGDTHR